MLCFLTFFSIASLIKYNDNLNKNRLIIQNESFVLSNISTYSKKGDVIASNIFKTNFIIPTFGPYGTLLINRNINKITLLDAIERMTLWAKIRGLTKNNFYYL